MLLHYLHRPTETTKTLGTVVFANPNGISLADAEARIVAELIDAELFIPNRLGIASLCGNTDPEEDDDYHEFVSVKNPEEVPTDARTIEMFIADLKAFKKANPDEFW